MSVLTETQICIKTIDSYRLNHVQAPPPAALADEALELFNKVSDTWRTAIDLENGYFFILTIKEDKKQFTFIYESKGYSLKVLLHE